MKNIRILCAADLHLGRRLVCLPEGIEEFAHAPKEVWKQLVSFVCASSNAIDALILSGDIFDNENDLYEAIGVFEEGINKIIARQIPVIAVAGNHDASLLKKCHRRMKGVFCLLGENETWENKSFIFRGQEVNFVGWSFSQSKCSSNPLQTFKNEKENVLSIGILHCDVTRNKESCYAPVELRDFRALSPKAWVLGHIHVPEILEQDPLVFYCGSLQGLDPSEKNARGATLLEITASGQISSTFLPLASLLWCCITIPLFSEITQSLDEFLYSALQKELSEIPSSSEVVMCRLVLQGVSSLSQEMESFVKKVEGRHFAHVGKQFIPCYIESVSLEYKPNIDLEILSEGRDLASIIAREIQSLNWREKKESFIKECTEFLKARALKNGNIEISEIEIEDLEIVCKEVGYEVLDKILRQEEIS